MYEVKQVWVTQIFDKVSKGSTFKKIWRSLLDLIVPWKALKSKFNRIKLSRNFCISQDRFCCFKQPKSFTNSIPDKSKTIWVWSISDNVAQILVGGFLVSYAGGGKTCSKCNHPALVSFVHLITFVWLTTSQLPSQKGAKVKLQWLWLGKIFALHPW